MQPILFINLSTGEIQERAVPASWQEAYLGGASLAARLLYDSLPSDREALSEEAPLLFLNGPLSGTLGPAVGRFVVCGLSPLTGRWAESHCGGFWGPELRFAGYDGVWIVGRAAEPVYLWIHNGQVEIRPARHLWGQDTYRTQEQIRAEIGIPGVRVACVGPAAENGVLFAGIFCDHGRTAGRTGLGTVMAARNLKAIAVRGTGVIPLADAATYHTLRLAVNRALKTDNQTRVLHALGTSGAADFADFLGAMPKRYYRQGTMQNVDRISGSTMAETILRGTSACHGCVIACGRVVDLNAGRQKGPEYETIVGFGPNLLIDDLAAITRLGDLCDRYGMDTISASNTIGLAFHLFERGLISENDTDGLTLHWGDAQLVEELIHRTARRQGFGDLLARGARYLGRYFGAEDEAVQVNGLEVAYHDPRAVSGMALSYATSPRGACHNQSDYFFVEWGQVEESLGLQFFDRQAGAEKAANVVIHQNWRTVFNALVICIFANLPPQTVVDLIRAACGYDWTLDDLLRCGERAWTLKRIINLRRGLQRHDDTLPPPLREPLPDGGAAGYVPPLEEMLTAYYAARGWDPHTGKPLPETLQRLGLEEFAAHLWA